MTLAISRALLAGALGQGSRQFLALVAVIVLAIAFVADAHAQSADLVVNHADTPDPGPAGGVFRYTIRVDNNGPSQAVAVALADTLPAGSTFIAVTTTQGTCSEASGIVNCALGDVAFLANVTIDIDVVLPTAGVWTNTASATSATPDPNPANNLNDEEGTTAQAAADMRFTSIVDTPDPVAAGQNFSYTLTARNDGPDPLTAANAHAIAFTIPTGVCVRSLPTGTGWSCTPAGGYPLCSGTISCTRAAVLAAGADAPALTVPAVANVGGSVTAAFQVASSLLDGDASNNTGAATTTIVGGASDVSITKTASPTTVAVGSNVTFTLTPRFNAGEPPGSLAPNVITVTDTLDASFTFVSASGTGWSCGIASQTVTCTRPGPYAGGVFTNMPAITIVATATATGSVSNTATVTAPETDPVPANNSSTIAITGSNAANLSTTKVASRNPVALNVSFNYTITARNNGPVAVASTNTITLTDALPVDIELVAAPTGTGWTCTPNSGFPILAALVSCTRAGPLATNTNAPAITLQVRAVGAAAHVNTACSALSGSGPSDSVPANDCGSATVTATSSQADLELVSKTASPDPVQVGSDLTYVITVRNNGADAATNVVVTDTLASLVTTGGFQSAVPSQGTCTPSGVTAGPSVSLSCNLGTLNAGATAIVTVVVRPTRATSGTRTNTAVVTSLDVGDPLPANNSRDVTSSVTAVSDVSVTKSATPSPVVAGTPLTYVVTARNNGPSTAQAVTINDPLPAGTAFVQLLGTTGGGLCTVPAADATSGTVSCTWTSIAAASQQTATFVVRPLTASAGGNIDNTATISTSTVESTPANSSATTNTPVAPAQVDILVNKADSDDPIGLHQPTVYTITVTNAGPSHATGVQLVDSFPSGGAATATFSYQGALTVSPPGVGSCTEPAIGATSGVLSCTFPEVAAGASAVVTYVMNAEAIASGISGTTFNAASVTANEPEIQPANNNTVHATTTRRTADLAIVKSGPPSFTPNVPFTWTLAIVNNGPNDSLGAVVTDALPAGIAFVAASPGCAMTAGSLTCTLGLLPVGAGTTLTMDVLPTSPYTGADPLVNTANVATVNEVDPNPANNTSAASSTPGPGLADLSIVKSGPASVAPGTAMSWQLLVTNLGPSAANGATFTDTLPGGVTGVSASCGTPSGGAACGAVSIAGATVGGTIPVLPPGASVTIFINASAPLGGGPLVNMANTLAPPGSVDPVPGNNSSTVTTTIPLPDLTIAKAASGPFTQGQVGATYVLTVSNLGPGATFSPVSVVDALPSGITATSIAGAGWSCTLSTSMCTRSDALGSGGSYPPITLTVDVSFSAPTPLINTATVTGGGESNTTNNASSVSTVVTASLPDLTVVKQANGTFTQGQAGASYTLTVTNAGTGPTSAPVSVTDSLPSGLTATAIGGTGWSCVLATLTCSRPDPLVATASYSPIVLSVSVAVDAPATLVNTATVSGGGEANTTNNSASATTPIVQLLPDLTIVKIANGSFAQGQVGATYTLTITNIGTGPTSGLVTVTDILPTGLTATAIAGTGWSCATGTSTCTRGDVLGAAASHPPITVTVNVAATAPATLVNLATISGGGESNTANNASSVTTLVSALNADLAMVKIANGTFSRGQVGATYTLIVSNAGPGTTSGLVTVTETAPLGLTTTGLSGSGWTCSLAALSCTRSDPLASGEAYAPIIVIVSVAPNAPSSIVNTASVALGGESNTANNAATATTPLAPEAGPAASIPTLSTTALTLLSALLLLLASHSVPVRTRRRNAR